MIRSLPPLNMGPTIENRAPSPLPPMAHDISRPSSASTQASNMLHNGQPTSANSVSLPALSTLASVAAAPSPPHMRFVTSIQCSNESFPAFAGMSKRSTDFVQSISRGWHELHGLAYSYFGERTGR